MDRAVELAITALRQLPYADYLRTAHWQRQRTFALEKAGDTCELCGRGGELEVHHRTYERLGFERPEDLVVLCGDCHEQHHRSLVLRAIRATQRAPLAVTVRDVLEKVG